MSITVTQALTILLGTELGGNSDQQLTVTLAVGNKLLGVPPARNNHAGFSFGIVQLDIGNNTYAQSAYASILNLLHSTNQIGDTQYARLNSYNKVQRPDITPGLQSTYARDEQILTTLFHGPSSNEIKAIIVMAQTSYLSHTLVPTINTFLNTVRGTNPNGNVFTQGGNDTNLALAAIVSLYNRNPKLFNKATSNLIGSQKRYDLDLEFNSNSI